MGRITPSNGPMCIRSEKVTQAQLTNLLKKMEKYDMREKETGEPRIHIAVGTEDLEEQSGNEGRVEEVSNEEGSNI